MNSASATNKNYRDILSPSGIGWVVYITLASAVLILYQFRSIQQYLGLPRDIQFSQFIKDTLDIVLHNSLGQGKTEVFVVGFFWAIVGLGVYIFLRGIAKALYDLGESIDQRGYVWPKGTNRYRPLIEAVERTGFRIGIAMVIIFWLLQPLARVLDGPIALELAGGSRILQYILWFVAIVLTLHGLIILARLFALRTRLLD